MAAANLPTNKPWDGDGQESYHEDDPRRSRTQSQLPGRDDPRSPRSMREDEERPQEWKPSSVLPDVVPPNGYALKWIRSAQFGKIDNKSLSARLREGWVPVDRKEYPELMVMSDRNSDFSNGIEIGGLLLCKMPLKNVQGRRAYYSEMARRQMESVDYQYLRTNDPRMPRLSERRSRVEIGKRNQDEE